MVKRVNDIFLCAVFWGIIINILLMGTALAAKPVQPIQLHPENTHYFLRRRGSHCRPQCPL
jgi:hypothetical protein